MPLFRVKVPKQEDGASCGYYIMRNLIGLLIAHETIFPINVGHVLGDRGKFETYLQLYKTFTTRGKLCLKNRITDKKKYDVYG